MAELLLVQVDGCDCGSCPGPLYVRWQGRRYCATAYYRARGWRR